MQFDTDGIRKKHLAKKREWAESDSAGFHALEVPLAHEAINLPRIMPFRLKP